MSKHLSFASFSSRSLIKNELSSTTCTLNQSNFAQIKQVPKLTASFECMTKLNAVNGGYGKAEVCESCEDYEACLVCVGCGEKRYCEGCFGKLHNVGKFRGHLTKKITELQPENNKGKQFDLDSSRALASLSPNSTIRARNSRKENKLTDQQLKQVLLNQIASFNIRYQAGASNNNQFVKKISTKWEQLEQLINDEMEKIKQMVNKIHCNLVKRVKIERQEHAGLHSVLSQESISMEEIRFDILQYQRAQRKINEGQLLIKIRKFNQLNHSTIQVNKVYKKKYEQEEKADRAIKIGLIEIKKAISNLNVENIFSKSWADSQNLTLFDSKFSMSTELDSTVKKNSKNQKYDTRKQVTKISTKQMKKGHEVSLCESFCSIVLEPSQNNNLMKRRSEILETFDINSSFFVPRSNRHRKTGSQLSQIIN